MKEKQRIALIKQSSIIGILGNLILTVMKLLAGFLFRSAALLADGIDSSSDIITSGIILFSSNIMNKPPDKNHPWGHYRIEAIATKVLSMIIMFAGMQLIINSIQKLIDPSQIEMPSILAVFVASFSMLAKAALAIYKYSIGRKTASKMIMADAVNMRNDIFLSLSAFTGILLTVLLKLPLLDSLTAVIISIFIIRSGIQIFLESSTELMDSIPDQEMYKKIFDAVESVDEASHPHKVRMRSIGNFYVIDVDVELPAKMTVQEAHDITLKVEEKIRDEIKNVYDVMIHIEPEGNLENECYGLSRKDFKNG